MSDDFEFGATSWDLGFTSKMGHGVGLPRPQGVPPDRNFFGWWTLPMGGSNQPSFVKIHDFPFHSLFVSCVDILLSTFAHISIDTQFLIDVLTNL